MFFSSIFFSCTSTNHWLTSQIISYLKKIFFHATVFVLFWKRSLIIRNWVWSKHGACSNSLKLVQQKNYYRIPRNIYNSQIRDCQLRLWKRSIMIGCICENNGTILLTAVGAIIERLMSFDITMRESLLNHPCVRCGGIMPLFMV